MARLGQALTQLSNQDLERLLKRVHDGSLECPINQRTLHMAGLSYLVDRVDFLHGHDARTVRAVLVAVLAERRARERLTPSG